MSSKLDIDLDAVVGVDSETCLIRPALPAPPVVCTGFYDPAAPEASRELLFGTADQWAPLLALFEDSRRLIVGHNFAYDIACYLQWAPAELRDRLARAIFAAYDADRVLDTGLAQRLVEIETGDMRGSLGLDALCSRYGLSCPKHEVDRWGREIRTGFGRFLGCRVDELPEEHRAYALGDPLLTHELLRRILQRGLVARADLARFTRADLALKLTAAMGLCTDPERVGGLEEQARSRIAELQDVLLENGLARWQRGKPQPVKNVKAIQKLVAAAYELPCDDDGKYAGPADAAEALKARGLVTDKGGISRSTLVLQESGDPLLIGLADHGEWAAAWNKDLRVFRWSAETGLPFTTRFGFAATTRTTSGGGKRKPGWIPGMNQQNFRKKAGIRECIRSRLGGLVASDYTGLENGTIAQTIFWTLGRRGMADRISAGWDFHCDVGSHILGVSYDEIKARVAADDPEAKACRAAAKPLNFGLRGYMQKASTVQAYARIGYGVNRPVEQWQQLIDLWYETQHDQVAYLREYVDGLRVGRGHAASYAVPIPGTGIVRRGATRTAAANTGFQGLGAQVALRGLYLIVRAQVLGELPGRACAFVHDEVISDARVEDVPEVADGHERLMLQATEELLPDVKMAVDTVAMSHWSKKAKKTHDAAGRLAVTAA